MLTVVRILQGGGLGALATLTPIYLAESSTPQKRGMLTGLHGFFLVSPVCFLEATVDLHAIGVWIQHLRLGWVRNSIALC